MSNYLVTWFYGESKEDESFYPSVGNKTSSIEFQKNYWRCIYVFYMSALLTNKSKIKYLFFTNIEEIPNNIDGVNINKFFLENDIKVIKCDLTKRTPPNWFMAWRNQFYEFDILNYLKSYDNARSNYLILDSDCIIRKDLKPVFEDIIKNQLIAYECSYELNHTINGISINEMNKLYEQFYGERRNVSYYGGEFIGLTSEALIKLLNEFYILWEKNYELYKNNAGFKLNEEAHFLSVLYTRINLENKIANKYIKRMWTALRCDNILKEDKDLCIWHLPAEKKYGFCELFDYLKEKKINEIEFLKISDKIMKISYPVFMRKINRIMKKR